MAILRSLYPRWNVCLLNILLSQFLEGNIGHLPRQETHCHGDGGNWLPTVTGQKGAVRQATSWINSVKYLYMLPPPPPPPPPPPHTHTLPHRRTGKRSEVSMARHGLTSYRQYATPRPPVGCAGNRSVLWQDTIIRMKTISLETQEIWITATSKTNKYR